MYESRSRCSMTPSGSASNASKRLIGTLVLPLAEFRRSLLAPAARPRTQTCAKPYTQYIALVALSEADEQTVGVLGEKLFLESNTLTPILKKLEQMGYIRRRRDPTDERQVRVSLTPAGRRLIEKDLGAPLADATGLGDELPVVQKTVTRLRDNLLRATQTKLEKR